MTKSAWASKINWTQAAGLLLGAATGLTGALPPEKAAVATVAIQSVQSLATIIFRTWFTDATIK